MRENAICALQMAVMLGEAVPTCYLFTQLSAAHLALREYRKAEAYAHTAIEVAENGCSILYDTGNAICVSSFFEDVLATAE